MDALIVASRAVHFVALALLFGAPLFRLAVMADDSGRGAPGGRAIEIAAAVAALASTLGWFVGVAATMAGDWSDVLAPDILQAVGETRFGRLWSVRLIAMVALLALHVRVKPSRAKDIALVVVAAGVTASLVGVGHGLAGAGALAPIHAVSDMTHLLCAATWVGGLFCLGQVVRDAMTGAAGPETVRFVLPRFSRIGYAAVALLVISGCVNALILVPRPEKLISTDYGRVLLVKIALAVVMVAIAVANRVMLTPKLMVTVDPPSLRTLWRSMLVEQGVGLLVLATVARLGTIHPVP